MNLLFDTNILIAILRSRDYDGIFDFLNPERKLVYISVATEAEIKSIALRLRWGEPRMKRLNNFLAEIIIVDINQNYINSYVEIDTYSQRINPTFTSYPFRTSRNMGKNDLWIASLASLLDLKLVTADSDFDHLNGVFFETRKIKPEEVRPFF